MDCPIQKEFDNFILRIHLDIVIEIESNVKLLGLINAFYG